MSLYAEDAIEGFSELLAAVGVGLIFDGQQLRALITTEQPKPEGFDLTPGDDQRVRVAAFASAFQYLPAIGDYFEDENGYQYRIRSRRQRPGQPVIRFSCEVSEA